MLLAIEDISQLLNTFVDVKKPHFALLLQNLKHLVKVFTELTSFSFHQSQIIVLVALEMLEHKESLIVDFVVEEVTMTMGAID